MIAAIAIIAEQRIREAMDKGAFDDLPMKGRPLKLDDDANIPEELRMAYKLLKNGGYLEEGAFKNKAAPVSLDDMLRQNPEERATVRQMLKFQVAEARFCERAGREPRLEADSAYHEKAVQRMTVKRQGGSS